MENNNFISKHIRELQNEKETIQDLDKIFEEMREFYEKLYTKQNNMNFEQSTLNHIKEKVSKINDKNKYDLEKDIDLNELGHIKNIKSPGPDGFTNKFYKKKLE